MLSVQVCLALTRMLPMHLFNQSSSFFIQILFLFFYFLFFIFPNLKKKKKNFTKLIFCHTETHRIIDFGHVGHWFQ